MRGGSSQSFNFFALTVALTVLCVHESCSVLSANAENSTLPDKETDELLPFTSPTASPLPFLPFISPSPLSPYTNSTIPKLSGQCLLNFTAISDMMTVTSLDCSAAFASVLANVVCCPQVEATLSILIGQSSKYTNTLALNGTEATHCLSDFEEILVSQGGDGSLCSVHSSNLTEGSCLVSDASEFESTVDSSTLLAACSNIDTVNECCEQVCENAILDAARKLAQKGYDLLNADSSVMLSDHSSSRINDCKSVVRRWLGSKLEPSHAKDVLRGLSNCRINKACPLTFPNMSHIIEGCRVHGTSSNKTACCSALESYVARLQRQSFVTNLQALNCATLLGVKLRKVNITQDLYSQCHISLKDFSIQVGAQESGCLLPSLPSDIVLDRSAGVSFLCDLNDNIPAPWPVSAQLPASSCNKTVKIPALPAAASGQSSYYAKDVYSLLCVMVSISLLILV